MNTIIDFLSSMSNWAIILLLLVGLGKVYSIFKNEQPSSGRKKLWANCSVAFGIPRAIPPLKEIVSCYNELKKSGIVPYN